MKTNIHLKRITALVILGTLVAPFFCGSAFSADDGDTVSFVGIKKSRTAKILDDFKENQDKILFNNIPFNESEEAGIFDSEEKIKNLEQMLKRIEESKDSLKEQKQAVTARKFTLTAMLADLDKDIADNEQKVSESEEMIRAKNKEIADTVRMISELQDRIDTNKQAILGYLSYLYSKSDLVYDDKNEVDVIKALVLSDGNLSDILSDLHFKSLIEVTGQNFLEERRALVKDYYVKTSQLKEEKNQVIQMKRLLEAKRLELDEQKAYKTQLLEVTQGREALFNEYIAERQAKQRTVEERLDQAIEDYDGAFESVAKRQGCKLTETGGVILDKKTTAKCSDLKQAYESEKNLREYQFDDTVPNPFAWPISPTYVSTYFHDADYYDSVGSEHEAVDLPVPQ